MNMILLQPEDFIDTETVRLTDYRFHHIRDVQKKREGSAVNAGLFRGMTGAGEISDMGDDYCVIKVSLNHNPPAAPECKVILALPRPKMFRRVLFTLTTLGIKEIFIINSWRVEKSYWQSPYLEEASLDRTVRAALEQCGDTVPPRIVFRKLFRPFAEDEMPEIIKGTLALAAHPGAPVLEPPGGRPLTLAIGPEGGFNEFEISMFRDKGFTVFSAGERILRVEDAVPALLGRLVL
jgi:RsmE family RNA methyltransferase